MGINAAGGVWLIYSLTGSGPEYFNILDII